MNVILEMGNLPRREATDALMLVGHGSRDSEGNEEFLQLARLLANRLGIVVQPCFLEFADPSILEGIRACIQAGGRRITILPLFLGPAGHQKNDVPALINWARTQWPEVEFRYGAPLGAQYALITALAERVESAIAASPRTSADSEMAVVLVGRGSRDPDSNSEVAKIARLLEEGRNYGWVAVAFYSLTGPDTSTVIRRCIQLGARRVVVVPYLLFTGVICRRIAELAQSVQALSAETRIIVTEHLGLHEGVIEAVIQRYQEAVSGAAAMTCDLCKYRQRFTGFEHEHALPQMSDHHHGLRGMPHQPAAFGAGLLPPRYQNSATVSATPMEAAPLQYTPEGQVAWEQMWTAFCDLALAGGPPHRGELLEPVPPEVVNADPERYSSVLDELERGIHNVTGLRVARGKAPGWIGVECQDEAMALWMLRAIVVENITVRREGALLWLPAGPTFRLGHEIKNIITAVAKTHHYWREHIAGLEGPVLPENGAKAGS